MTHTLPTAVIVELPEGAISARLGAVCNPCNSVGVRHCAHPEECEAWENILTYTIEETGFIGDHIIQCVPEYNNYSFDLPQSNYTHAKLLEDVSEDEAAGMVEEQDEGYYRNYMCDEINLFTYPTALASLHSLTRHIGYKNAAVAFKEK